LRRKNKRVHRRFIHVEKRIQDKGFEIPPPVKPAANYIGCVRSGNTIYVSGHLPYHPPHFYNNEYLIKGKVGAEVTVENAALYAKYIALGLIGTLKSAVGDLDKVRIVKVFGIVNCVDGFKDQPKVMNGCSDFLVEMFQERGKHARSAIGTNALPFNVPVEIEMVVEVVD